VASDKIKLTSVREAGRGYHDIGGLDYGTVDPAVTEARPWEKLSVVLGNAIGRAGTKTISVDEVRRSREEMGEQLYNELGYFERGIESMRRLLIEKGVLSDEELETRMTEIAARIRDKGR
jgi:nitrile hydratase subunit beta